jgi:serine/threonine-protein kinase RsbW
MRMQRKFSIESEMANLRAVEKQLDDFASILGITEDNYGKIMVCAMEAVNNAIIHGNRSDKKKSVNINIENTGDDLTICVEDEGQGFKPGEIPDPTKPENIEELTGRGVFLMSRLADKIEFNEKGNIVIMHFKDIRT